VNRTFTWTYLITIRFSRNQKSKHRLTNVPHAVNG